MTIVLGMDFGTGGVRVGIYDAETKSMLATASVEIETRFPHHGWAEQSPADWLVAMRKATRSALASAGRRDVAAICVATTASTVALSTQNGVPIAPAILWMDCRADVEARATAKISHPVMQYCGGSDAVEWLVPKAMWLSRHAPTLYDRADIICEAIDFINFHLTGEWTGSRMNAACKWNWDSARSVFVPEIYDALGVPELIDKLPNRIVPVGDAIAPIRPQMAAELGIEGQPIVAQGGIDAHIGILGAGTVEEGGMLLIGGSSVVQLVQLGSPADMSGFWGPYPNALVDDLWLVEAGQVSAGSILNWLSGTLFELDARGQTDLMELAASRRAGGSGLLTLDHWMGNRTPYRDGQLRGAILGLSLGHDRADIYASAIDGIALGSANTTAVLKERGVDIEHIVVAGGICQNPLWLQASIDALGQPVSVARTENLTLLGTAISALSGLDCSNDLRAIAAEYASESEEMLPDPDRAAWFQDELQTYRATTQALVPTLHALATAQLNKPTTGS